MYGRFSVTSPDKASLPPGSCAPLAAVSPSLTLVEVMSIITSWKAAVSSACLCVCSAIFSLNFRGLEAPEPVPELGPGPGPQPLEPVADIFTERTERLDVVEWFFPPRRWADIDKTSHSDAFLTVICFFKPANMLLSVFIIVNYYCKLFRSGSNSRSGSNLKI